jgi:hypothetical protein
VWYDNEDVGYNDDEYTLLTFFGWLGLCLAANVLHYRLTRRKIAQAVTGGGAAAAALSIGGNSTVGGSVGTADVDAAKSSWRFQSQVFQPPENVCFAATELSKATAHVMVATVRSPFQSAGSTLSRIRSNASVSSLYRGLNSPTTAVDNGDNHQTGNDHTPISVSPRSNRDINNSSSNRARINTEATVVSTASVVSSSNSGRPRSNSEGSRAFFSSSYREEPSPRGTSSHGCHPLDSVRTSLAHSFGSLNASEVENDQDLASNCGADKDDELCPENQPSPDLDDAAPVDTDDNNGSPNGDHDPSLWYMIKTNSCCGKRHRYEAPSRKGWEKVLHYVKWSLWSVTSVLHLCLIVINIGATSQQNRVRLALPGTFQRFYPDNYLEATMCAWDKASPDADIRTFDTLEEVQAANYTVVHCGACGACSNWDDLSLQWTTRTFLAEAAQKW